MKVRSVGAGVVAVVVGLVLGGCSGGSDAGPTTSPAPAVVSPTSGLTPGPVVTTPAATPATTPTAASSGAGKGPAAPVRPKGMDAKTAEGARKTALYFISLYPYVMATGDMKDFDALSVYGKDACGFCNGSRSDVRKYQKKHWTYTGGQVKAKVVHTYAYDELFAVYPLDVQVDQKVAIIRDKTGKLVKREAANSTLDRVEVIRVGKGWKILTIANIKDL